MNERLIIFTRYPEPGKTKTRLIPALGKRAAAELQRAMTRHILGVADQLALDRSVQIEVRFEGGDEDLMENCFGAGRLYRPQGPGDLGTRMQRAFVDATVESANRVILIGADCPGIDVELLKRAFAQLSTTDVVLGPAHDGGYYLIGLKRLASQLFVNISWGGHRVLEQTLCQVHRLSLAVGLLKTLSDVDHPEDLPVWQQMADRSYPTIQNQRISIVIPVLNEVDKLPGTLSSIEGGQDTETVVVDGGSCDGTLEVAERAGCHVLRSSPGRANQLNAGAECATGEILLFVHADTLLPAGFDSAIRSTLGRPGVVAGAFRLCIDAPGWNMRAIERGVGIRCGLLQMPYGDQAIFVSKALFREVGGFPELPIMEDFGFVRQLRRRGAIQMLSLPVTTSGRRWKKIGPWRTTWINQKVILGYYLGLSPERLAAWYQVTDREVSLESMSKKRSARSCVAEKSPGSQTVV